MISLLLIWWFLFCNRYYSLIESFLDSFSVFLVAIFRGVDGAGGVGIYRDLFFDHKGLTLVEYCLLTYVIRFHCGFLTEEFGALLSKFTRYELHVVDIFTVSVW